jgi:hypothetical protein
MLGQAVARGDSRSISASLQAIDAMHEQYIAAAETNPSARTHQYERGTTQGWFANEVPEGLVAAAQDALHEARSSETDVLGILDTIERIGQRSIAAGHEEEANTAVTALAEVGTSIHQAQPSGVVNHPTRTVTNLAQLEAAAESHAARGIAAHAIAAITLILCYAESQPHINVPLDHYPTYPIALRLLGSDPPFYDAGDLIEDRHWVETWANKLPPIPQAVLIPLGILQRTIDAHSQLHNRPAPTPPQKQGVPWYI